MHSHLAPPPITHAALYVPAFGQIRTEGLVSRVTAPHAPLAAERINSAAGARTAAPLGRSSRAQPGGEAGEDRDVVASTDDGSRQQ